MDRQHLLGVARGDIPADLVVRGARLVNVFTGTIERGDIAVAGETIAAIGEVSLAGDEIRADGHTVIPGLIDTHVHIESSMVSPQQFARAVAVRGVTTVVCDPHEIANVSGLAGVYSMLQASEGLPITIFFNAPSCVPATHLATAGASLGAAPLGALLDHPRILGLAEVMNVPGTVLGDPEVLAKLDRFADRPMDGHAPGVSGPWLNAYVAAGISTDHECITAEEAREKLARGLRVLIREGTGAKNLRALLEVVTPATSRRCAFCTDDRHPHDLLDEGSIDHMVRTAIALGLDPVTAVQLATLNGAETFGLGDRGAIAPGRRADLVVVDDVRTCQPRHVVAGGRWIVRDGALTTSWSEASSAETAWPSSSVRIPLDQLDLTVPARGDTIRVIGLVPGQIVTEHRTTRPTIHNGRVVADAHRDLAHLVVVERHHGSGAIGHGFVQGLGLQRGAIASTVAHDHHNLIVASMDDASLRAAIVTVINNGGGLAACRGEEVLASMPLPIAGLMSDQSLEATRSQLDALVAAARQLGATGPDPFMSLSFLALEVIPSLKLTDRGLVDVERFELVNLWVQ